MSEHLIVQKLKTATLNGLIGLAAAMLIAICSPFWLYREFRQAVRYWWLRVREEWSSAREGMGEL